MVHMTAERMREIDIQKESNKKQLAELMATPFDPSNAEQLKKLAKYIDQFECAVNQQYLFQAMNQGLTMWGVSTAGLTGLGRFLPVPDFVVVAVFGFFYVGVMGLLLENFSINAFHDQLQAMKTLYNWCLKGGKKDYENQENNEAFAKPEIQRLLKLLAPLCDVDFMLAWKAHITKRPEQPAGFAEKIYNYARVPMLYFSTAPKPIDNSVRGLQMAVENRALDIGVSQGLQQALRYFSTDAKFRSIAMEKITSLPMEAVASLMPSKN